MTDKNTTQSKDTEKTTDSVSDLKDLGAATKKAAKEAEAIKAGEQAAEIVRVAQKDALGRSSATGRRKSSVSRVWLKRGSGQIVVNGKKQDEYFARKTHVLIINQPFLEIGEVNTFDVYCTVKGGGLSGQAGALRHGISRALEKYDPEFRPALKKAGMLTRDARQVERKKVGRHKARRSKQFSKR